MDNSRVWVNGLNGETGAYLLPNLSNQTIAEVALGDRTEPAHTAELAWRKGLAEAHLGVIAGVDVKDLSSAGWAVVFAAGADEDVRDALRPLLELRRRQASVRSESLYRECWGDPSGYRGGESKSGFLRRQGAPGSGPVDPRQFPYYVLLVGSPEAIPYSFQYQLDVQYAVGRIHFDFVEDYARYAESVVAAETGKDSPGPRTAAFFAPANPEDEATRLSSTELASPLAEFARTAAPNWQVQAAIGETASKSRLASWLGGEERASFLFTAGHGLGFSSTYKRQQMENGALVCQDWPGASWSGPLRRFAFAADDLSADARLAGMVAMLFACYGAGTPQYDDFCRPGVPRRQLSAQPFVAELPKRMLAHPNGGALAVIGHVDRAWDCSFSAGEGPKQLAAFQSAVEWVLGGYPVGAAMEFFNQRYAELSSDLNAEREDIDAGKRADDDLLAALWKSNRDARNYSITGDPAVRLQAAPEKPVSTIQGEREVRTQVGGRDVIVSRIAADGSILNVLSNSAPGEQVTKLHLETLRLAMNR